MCNSVKKRLIYILLLFMISNIFSYPIEANNINNNADDELLKAYFTDINSFNVSLNIKSNGSANIEAFILSYQESTVKIKCYLQQYNGGKWRNVKLWELERNKPKGHIIENYYVKEGYAYRLKSYVYVYDMKGKLLESASKMSKEIKY